MLIYLVSEQVIPSAYSTSFYPYTPNRPDIVIHNKESNAVALLELVCHLESIHHLELVRDRKLAMEEYQLLLSELDRLAFITQLR